MVRKKHILEYILFFIWPVASLVRALSKYKSPWAKNILWLFVAFYGFAFLSYSDTADSLDYMARLATFHSQDITFNDFVSDLYVQPGPHTPDLFEPFLTYIISRFTDDSRIFFAVVGLVFGFFYSRNIWFIIDHTNGKLKKIILPFFLLTFVIIPFWQINGVRFFTAANVFLYGILPYLVYKEKKYLFFTVLAGFFHFSLFAALPLILIYIFIGNRTSLFFILYLISFGFTQISIEPFQELINYLPAAFQMKFQSYLQVERAIEVAEHDQMRSTLNIITLESLRYVILILTIIVYIIHKKNQLTKAQFFNLFPFALLFLGIFNILAYIPSVYRFIPIGNFIMIGFFILFFQNYSLPKKLKPVLQLTISLILLHIIGKLYVGTKFIGLYFFTNPIIALWGPGEFTLFDLVGF
ncbi:MAG: EpsG family protein [bacterium]